MKQTQNGGHPSRRVKPNHGLTSRVARHLKETLKLRKIQLLFCLAALLVGATQSGANPVLDWNNIAAQTILAPSTRGPAITLDFAVVHAAMHDAVQAYDKRFEPYAIDVLDAEGSVAAAVAKAAHDVLVNRFPAQAGALGLLYGNYLADHALAADDPGVHVGAEVAAGMIALRANDGSFPAVFPPFTGANLIGVWRPTPSYNPGPPPSFAPMVVPWAAQVTPFVALSPSQFRAEPPPHLNSAEYARDYNEVKALGSLENSARTPEQTQLAYFFADNFFAQWHRVIRSIAEMNLDNEGDTARLLALSWLAVADAFITTWESKIYYSYWRPVTAIQEGDNDGNKKTAGDPDWKPFLNTPNYPEYTSGANGVVGAIFRTMRLYFGTDNFTFFVTSNHPLAAPNVRIYERFSDAAQDMVDVRIYHGLHFRSGDEAGRKVGRQAAKWVFHNALRPLHGLNAPEDDGEADE